ncbi:alpha/beta hydrolase [Streptomyces sp. NBC_01465]|uniref:alpha/beta hydrolase n=1 Tax=Streptomyces sp. NBC_01465 TaxID=2903878 RepID=UPI002E344679|nr:alpha/beta hydrolase [Streptomyces sp. NBC_01465]
MFRRRAAATLLAAVVTAAGAGCDPGKHAGPGGGGGTGRRVEAKASNPPPGLPAALTAGQRLHWSACPAPTAAQGNGDAPGAGWECATMKAPLDYRKPARETIGVALIRKRATGPENKRLGSLLLNFGGPGVSGVMELPEFEGMYRSLGERYDLVSFDPRGVGGTIPVNCGAKAYEGSDACKRYSGKFLPYVGTSHTARDLDLMRYLLGDKKLNYFGVSYGTKLGAVYAHLYPKNVGRLVLDAPVDPTQDRAQADVSQAKAVQRAFERFAQHCASSDDDCPTGSDPGQADRRVIELMDKLDKTPAPTGGKEKLNGELTALAIANFLDLGEDSWASLIKALKQVVEQGSGSQLMRKAYDHEPGARARQGSSSGGNGTSALVAITCADSNLRPGFTQYDDMAERVTEASPVFGKALSGNVYLCFDWPFAGESATPDVSAPGAAPILVVANTGDPTTPYEGGPHMVNELGTGVGVLLTVRAEGHGSYPQVRCAAKAIDTYLFDGRLPERGTTCS